MSEIRLSPKPDIPADTDGEPATNPGAPVDAAYLKRKIETARLEGEQRAKTTGLTWGAGLIVVAVATSFCVWFKAEAMAQEKVDAGIATADSHTDKKLEDLKLDVAVLKNDMKTVKDQTAKSNDQQAEIIRLLKRKAADK